MSTAIERMLESYEVETIYDQKNAMKEIMQEIVLCGLSRAGFFKKAAFYGGTALRIFYDLDCFSEDLDFSLIQPDLGFSLKDYFPILEKEVRLVFVWIFRREKSTKKVRSSPPFRREIRASICCCSTQTRRQQDMLQRMK